MPNIFSSRFEAFHVWQSRFVSQTARRPRSLLSAHRLKVIPVADGRTAHVRSPREHAHLGAGSRCSPTTDYRGCSRSFYENASLSADDSLKGSFEAESETVYSVAEKHRPASQRPPLGIPDARSHICSKLDLKRAKNTLTEKWKYESWRTTLRLSTAHHRIGPVGGNCTDRWEQMPSVTTCRTWVSRAGAPSSSQRPALTRAN
jgi:hypothetical protein